MQGFNMGRYVPPDQAGLKSFNQASGKKPTNRCADGSQTVRFELPFATWCTTCTPEAIIGQGVRFNATKQKVGNYYSTPIWAFRIKHTVCGGWIEIRTDPKNAEYVVVSGGRKRDNGEGKVLEGEILVGEAERREKDGVLGLLEKRAEDKEVANAQWVRIEELKRRSERDWADPYELNKKIRKEFRVGRRERQADERSGELLQDKFGLGLDLIAPSDEDGQRARLVDYGVQEERSATAKGLFEVKSLPAAKAVEMDRGRRGRNAAGGQKSALQMSLKGNTRAKTDPFVKGTDAWHPATKLKGNGQVKADPDCGNGVVAESDAEKQEIVPSATASAALVPYDSD